MSSIARLRRGSVLKVYKYGDVHCDCWAFIEENSVGQWSLDARFIVGTLPHNRGDDNKATIDDEDKFTVVPADELPDDVITELARMQLMGEI